VDRGAFEFADILIYYNDWAAKFMQVSLYSHGMKDARRRAFKVIYADSKFEPAASSYF
jgi:hypothetical protein